MHDDPFDDMPPELLATLDRVRAHYGETAPPVAGPGLSAFLSVGLTSDNGDLPATAASNANEPAATQVVGLPNWRTTLTQRRRQAMRTIAALIGTTLGKVVLGTTVAAASVGAGQASGVIDMNGDPARTGVMSIDDELDSPEVEADELEADELEADDASDPVEDADDLGGVDDQGEDADDQGENDADADDDADDADEADDDADDADEDDEADDVDEADDDADEDDEADDVDEADDDADEIDDEADDVDEADDDANESEGAEIETDD